MTATTIAASLVVDGVIVSLAMILYFLWLVYERGGPKHVGDVAKALRVVYDPNWPTKLLGYLPNVDADDEQDIDSADELPQPHHRTQSAEALGARGCLDWQIPTERNSATHRP